MPLPQAFIDDIKPHLSAAEWEAFEAALTEGQQPTSVRLNPQKPGAQIKGEPVGWCPEGRYLASRPQFTLDPLLHAGAYYVQEASSMFVAHVIRTLLPNFRNPEIQNSPLLALDLCAAPGGKSTAALSALPEGSHLVSNEIDRKRARILAENIQKWGNPNVTVTANAPADFKGLNQLFDVIITDVPCSGEGMFRKDAGAIAEWNPAKVRECVGLQRQIVSDIWPSLKPGGLLIYSTCTFNVHEDEEMLQYICDELGAELLEIPVQPEWHIHPALCGSFAPSIRPTSACRFMPHYTQGEGLFMAAFRKTDASGPTRLPKPAHHKPITLSQQWLKGDMVYLADKEGNIRAIPESHYPLHQLLEAQGLYLLSSGVEVGTPKGKDLIPAHALALSTALRTDAFPHAELPLDVALQYLRREAITLPPETPNGFVLCTYRQVPLGFVKNIGNRSNNLYPTEWRIRNL